MSLPDRFWEKTQIADCVMWTGALNSRGYGCFGIDGTVYLVHRLVWEDTHGPIPAGMTIDHTCRVRNCVNVAHLEVVSRGENLSRRHKSYDMCQNGHTLTERGRGDGTARACRICEREQSKAKQEAS